MKLVMWHNKNWKILYLLEMTRKMACVCVCGGGVKPDWGALGSAL